MHEPLRVVVVGAGPAGIYTAEALVGQDTWPVRVDILDRLPTPFGLLRYGVAPDHVKIKSIDRSLQRILDHDGVRFFGNVECGRDVTADELRERYHAVVYAFGAATDRRLGIPGEDLIGSISAREFVAWYNGYPDEAMPESALTHPGVAIIGLGNVALDVARVLAKPVGELTHTDMPDAVLRALHTSIVTDIHLVGRGRPVAAKFTTKELREFGEVEGLDIVVDPDDLFLTPQEESVVAADPTAARNLDVLREWAARPRVAGHRRLHFHFGTRPVEIVADAGGDPDRIAHLRVEHHVERPVPRPEDQPETLDVALVLRAIGYLGVPMDGVPFDDARGVVPTDASRVLRDGAVSVGEYAAGWISRGATGVIGTNRADGKAVAATIVADADELLARTTSTADLADLLSERVPELVTLEGWSAIDTAERELGAQTGRARAKIAETDGLLAAAQAADNAPPS